MKSLIASSGDRGTVTGSRPVEEMSMRLWIRPGKVDSLFPVSCFLDLKAGGWAGGHYSLLIMLK